MTKNIAIVMPTGDTIHADTAMSLARMIAMDRMNQFAFINPRCSTIAKGRWMGVKAALEMDPDFILFIDSDMVFPFNAVHMLMNHGQMMVSGHCTTRREPIHGVSRDKDGNFMDFTGEYGIQAVETTGLAFCLVHRSLFKAKHEPWFETSFDAERERPWLTEDEHFCKIVRSTGTPIYVDVDLKIGHIGTVTYGL